MATILLSAAGAAVGGMTSGTLLGLSGAVIGRAVGATVGRVIDQKILGSGSDPIEQGRVDQFRLLGAEEGAPVAQLFGRMRLGGQVIWSTGFRESTVTTGGGKGAPSAPATTQYSYSISVAIALCAGEIRRIGRIWADGTEIDRDGVTMRVYTGSEDQLPDPLMEAIEGAGRVPAYRGIAYVVFEDLELASYGNRVPQFSFEITRAAQPDRALSPAAADLVTGVALMPGTGEYALATTPVAYQLGFGEAESVNVNAAGGGTDFDQSLRALGHVLPSLKAVSLIYSWFGDDLRVGSCAVKPKVEDRLRDGAGMPWRAGGIDRGQAEEIARLDDRPVYGGTPTDQSVIQAITAMRDDGLDVLFYPFLLMEILDGNGLPDPYGRPEQPPLPWRGRMTGDVAPGHAGTTDGTSANAAAVDRFFGSCRASDFTVSPGTVSYGGPADWSYSRFILHSAALCAAAGGVESFCIGSEMRGLTQMRDAHGFPAVERLRALAVEVRVLLPGAKLSYAADWSEYFGYQPQDGSGDVYFHLDPLWADDEIDFIAIDNYMPLSDWRDGGTHADAQWETIYDLAYLKANVEGGEGYDWYYPTDADREAQRRTPIEDGAHGEDWIFGYKALREWWGNPHYERRGGTRRENLVVSSEVFGDAAWSKTSGAAVVAAANAGPTSGQNADRLDFGTAASSGLAQTVTLSAGTYTVSLWVRGLSGQVSLRLGLRGGAGAAQTSSDRVVGASWQRVSHTVTVAAGSGEVSVLNASGGGGGSLLVSGLQLEQASFAGDYIKTEGAAVPLQRTAWVPGSKPVRFTEIGCAAIDKGTNQPNKFLDAKSSESAIPYFSSGRRDDLIQAQYLRAIMEYWAEPGRNPVSPVYAGPMLDLGHTYAWAWDARPWPAFPALEEVWSDGANWTRGHWITGRIEAAPLDHVVAELCEAAGVTAYDVSRLYGLVRGHLSGETESARARLQSLMMAFGFQAVERDGQLVFLPLPNAPAITLEHDMMVPDGEMPGVVTETRAAEAEVSGRVRVRYAAAELSYEERVAEAIFPGDATDGVGGTSLPMAMTGAEAQAVAERWLSDTRIAQDTIKFTLPPSRRALGAGDMVATGDGVTWRIDRVEDRGAREIEAVRVEPTTHVPSEEIVDQTPQARFAPPLPVSAVFMDLPLLTGEEKPAAPHLAVAASPWPGSIAVYDSPAEDGFSFNRTVDRGAIAGTLLTPLAAAPSGVWDRSGPLQVRIAGGALSSASENAVLNGANVAAVGSGDGSDWEILQFADVRLVGDGVWEIGLRLRGQQGTDAVMPAVWPAGSLLVLLNGAPVQVDLGASSRGLERHWRIGPASRPLDDASFVERVIGFEGIGLRPYAPVHLSAGGTAGDVALTWIRRGRIDADSWMNLEVPLGEAFERYLVQVRDAGGLKREEIVDAARFAYPASNRAADGVSAPFSIHVAQLSDRFGPGPFARIEIDD